MNDIESITSVIQHLNADVTFWNTLRYVCVGATALFTVLSFFTFWVSGIRTDSLGKAKDELIRLKDQGKDLQIASLNAEAARAKEGIAIAQVDAATANTRTAEAELKIEQLRADNLALQKLIQPRRLPDSMLLGIFSQHPILSKAAQRAAQQAGAPPEWALFNIIAPFKGTPVVIQAVPDFEAKMLANDMFRVLSNFGWKPELVNEAQTGVQPSWIDDGVEVTFWSLGKYGEAARAFGEALEKVGIAGSRSFDFEMRVLGYNVGKDGNPVLQHWPHFDPARDTVVVLIGMKPIPATLGGEPNKKHFSN